EEGIHRGAALERAARLLRAGHAGQTLCSEETAVLLRRELEPDVRLADLGLYRLASAAAPERIFQLADRETELGEFPPPNAERGHRSNLPLQSTRFFGRETEIAGLGALLERSRLVTLTGSGGSGKTRLALEVARQLGERFAGAVWFVPLADLVE